MSSSINPATDQAAPRTNNSRDGDPFDRIVQVTQNHYELLKSKLEARCASVDARMVAAAKSMIKDAETYEAVSKVFTLSEEGIGAVFQATNEITADVMHDNNTLQGSPTSARDGSCGEGRQASNQGNEVMKIWLEEALRRAIMGDPNTGSIGKAWNEASIAFHKILTRAPARDYEIFAAITKIEEGVAAADEILEQVGCAQKKFRAGVYTIKRPLEEGQGRYGKANAKLQAKLKPVVALNGQHRLVADAHAECLASLDGRMISLKQRKADLVNRSAALQAQLVDSLLALYVT